MKSGLDGQIALVTGANQGIGAAVARALAAEGAHVFITFFRPALSAADEAINSGRYASDRAKDAQGVLADCCAFGVRAAAFETDLSDPHEIAPLYDTCETAIGPPDILVHNASAWQADTFAPPALRDAGSWPPPYLLNLISVEGIERHFAVNARATALLIAEYARRHSARGAKWGRIISLTTVGAAGFPGEVSYGASKAALESYSRAAAKELGPLGVTVSIVCPGPTQTGCVEATHAEALTARTPLRRLGQPEDGAGAVMLLASEQANWITGQCIAADGGFGL